MDGYHIRKETAMHKDSIKRTTLAGIITYNPDIERLQLNIDAVIRNGMTKIVVADNASKNIASIEALFLEYPGIEMIKNSKNEGVAYALNQIFQAAYDSGQYEWVLTLDQDSIIDDDMIATYEQYYTGDNRVASITSQHRERAYEVNKKPQKEIVEYTERCITSGNLVKVSAWKEVGGFETRLFIDYVDFEFCYRLREHGYLILRINKPLLLHELGDPVVIRVLGKERIALNHSALRKYYMVRNSLYCHRYYGNYTKGKNLYYYHLFRFFVRTLLIEKEDKQNKLHSIIKGFYDGMKMEKLL